MLGGQSWEGPKTGKNRSTALVIRNGIGLTARRWLGYLGEYTPAGCSIPPIAPAEDDRRIEGLANPTTDGYRPAVRPGFLAPDMGVE